MRNIAVSRYRVQTAKKRRLPEGSPLAELGEYVPSFDNIESEMDAKELAGDINEGLAGLSADDRALFILRYWHGCGVSELAQRTGKTPEKVSQTIYRLKKKLRTHLTAKGVVI